MSNKFRRLHKNTSHVVFIHYTVILSKFQEVGAHFVKDIGELRFLEILRKYL